MEKECSKESYKKLKARVREVETKLAIQKYYKHIIVWLMFLILASTAIIAFTYGNISLSEIEIVFAEREDCIKDMPTFISFIIYMVLITICVAFLAIISFPEKENYK